LPEAIELIRLYLKVRLNPDLDPLIFIPGHRFTLGKREKHVPSKLSHWPSSLLPITSRRNSFRIHLAVSSAIPKSDDLG
jgi:hypothetical protein